MICDTSNSTRYNRQNDTRSMLEYVHGGREGAIFGAWDFIQRFASSEQLEKLIINYERGNFIEKLHGKFSNTFRKSKDAMNQALATKYELYLSRRKFTFLCKIQSSTFEPIHKSGMINQFHTMTRN